MWVCMAGVCSFYCGLWLFYFVDKSCPTFYTPKRVVCFANRHVCMCRLICLPHIYTHHLFFPFLYICLVDVGIIPYVGLVFTALAGIVGLSVDTVVTTCTYFLLCTQTG